MTCRMKNLYKKITANAFTLFLVKAFVFYAVWWFLYNIVMPRFAIDDHVIGHQVKTSGSVLEELGYKMEYAYSGGKATQDMLWITGSQESLQVEKACDSVDLMGLFAVFVLAYPGRWRNRLWYIPAGMLLIHILNIARICALVVIEFNRPDLLEFNHKYTFTGVMYLCIFSMWYLWVKYFSHPKQ